MSARDMHTKKAHSLIGVGAALLGVALGIGVVYWDGMNDQPAAYAQGGSCQQKEQACVSKKIPYSTCHQEWVQCVTEKCMGGGGAVGQCNQDPECQSSCTESATSQGGKISCCEGGPKHGNACKDKVDGQCNPKQTELGKGMMPMMMPMMMGMMGMPPMIPMIPKGEPKPKEPPQEECQKEPKPEHCKSGVSDSLFGSLKQNVQDFFSPGSSETGGQQSVGDQLQSLLFGDSSNSSGSNATAGTNNPTQAVVTPVVSGSNAGGLSAQGGTQSGNNSGNQGQNVNAAVTGFGGGSGASADTSTGPILSAIKSVTSRIQSILSSWF